MSERISARLRSATRAVAHSALAQILLPEFMGLLGEKYPDAQFLVIGALGVDSNEACCMSEVS